MVRDRFYGLSGEAWCLLRLVSAALSILNQLHGHGSEYSGGDYVTLDCSGGDQDHNLGSLPSSF